MITLEKIIELVNTASASATRGIPRKLPNDISKYTQKTAVDIRKEELEAVRKIDETMAQYVDFTMDAELKEFATDKELKQRTIIGDAVCATVPNNCLITYVENSIATTPTVILDAFKNCKMNPDDWYIYGFKNPESLCKCLLMLTTPDFMLKNKNDRRNEVLTLKREMAINLDAFYKRLGYRALKFNRTEMMDGLMNKDNYTSFDFMTLAADYYQANFLIVDIIGAKYIDVTHKPHKLVGGSKNNGVDSQNSATPNNSQNPTGQYMVIIKYINNIYLPLMTNQIQSGKYHYVPNEYAELIKRSYEKEPVEPRFKYRCNEVAANSNNTISTENGATVVSGEGGIPPKPETEVVLELRPTPNTETVKRETAETVLSMLDITIPIYKPVEKKSAKDKTSASTNENKSTDADASENEPELNSKNIEKLTLGQLQSMAQSKGIAIDKVGKTAGKMVRKTKAELFAEIQQISTDKKE